MKNSPKLLAELNLSSEKIKSKKKQPEEMASVQALWQKHPQAGFYADKGKLTLVEPNGQTYEYSVPSLVMGQELQQIRKTLSNDWKVLELEAALLPYGGLEQFVREDPDRAVTEDYLHHDTGSGDNLYEALKKYLRKLGFTQEQFMYA